MIGIYFIDSDTNTVISSTCSSNTESGIYLNRAHYNTVSNNTCTSNDIGIYLLESDSNTMFDNTCNNNRIGIYLYRSSFITVVNNTCSGNTEHDIYLYDSDTITEMTGEFDSAVLLLIGLVGVTLLGAGWWKVSARGNQDDIIVPTRYRLVSWLRKRRSPMHIDVDDTLEPDSSDQ
jgi:parallel beta-helix repeat protein